MYEKVAKLFKNQDDLLMEFSQFLPDANNSGGGSSNNSPVLAAYTSQAAAAAAAAAQQSAQSGTSQNSNNSAQQLDYRLFSSQSGGELLNKQLTSGQKQTKINQLTSDNLSQVFAASNKLDQQARQNQAQMNSGIKRANNVNQIPAKVSLKIVQNYKFITN